MFKYDLHQKVKFNYQLTLLDPRCGSCIIQSRSYLDGVGYEDVLNEWNGGDV